MFVSWRGEQYRGCVCVCVWHSAGTFSFRIILSCMHLLCIQCYSDLPILQIFFFFSFSLGFTFCPVGKFLVTERLVEGILIAQILQVGSGDLQG